MRFGKLVLAALLLATAVNARPSQAQLTFYTDRPTFLAATSSTTTIDFEGLAPDSGFVSYSTPPGLTVSGVNFNISTNGVLFTIGKDFYYPGTSVLSSQGASGNTNDLIITLPATATAIGLDISSFGTETITFNLSTGDTFTATPPALPALAFIGVTSAASITSLTLSQPDIVLNIDNFTFGTAAAVPEPGSVALLTAISTVGAAFLRRRKQSHKAA